MRNLLVYDGVGRAAPVHPEALVVVACAPVGLEHIDAEEAQRGITIYSAAVTCRWKDVTINIIDDIGPRMMPFTGDLFDFGKNQVPPRLPQNMGFAGFRILYPLDADYIPPIKEFIERLNRYPELQVTTNAMSTQISGEHARLFEILGKETAASFGERGRKVFVMKVLGGAVEE